MQRFCFRLVQAFLNEPELDPACFPAKIINSEDTTAEPE
jgi:hypothetical protein